ncbi:MAG: RNA polymerase sigma factor RpoD, partial [Erysipelotrichales bacterium]|nr:RNA polymerase sigma factor RpoD [Erysipelotrichales bacterium]
MSKPKVTPTLYKTLDDLKGEFKELAKKDGFIPQKDIFASIEHLELNEDELDDLMVWFRNENIKIVDELEPGMIDDLNQDDVFLDDDISVMDDEFAEDDTLSLIDPSIVASGNIKVNDPVKMYLKEIGRVSLLNPDDEPEIARRIQAGDEEAKRILIASNLRLVVSIAKKYV